MAECNSAFYRVIIGRLHVNLFATLIKKRSLKMGDPEVPAKGHWPVDPQEDIPVSEDRIWVDGCFDFSHHGIVVAVVGFSIRGINNSL